MNSLQQFTVRGETICIRLWGVGGMEFLDLGGLMGRPLAVPLALCAERKG